MKEEQKKDYKKEILLGIVILVMVSIIAYGGWYLGRFFSNKEDNHINKPETQNTETTSIDKEPVLLEDIELPKELKKMVDIITVNHACYNLGEDVFWKKTKIESKDLNNNYKYYSILKYDILNGMDATFEEYMATGATGGQENKESFEKDLQEVKDGLHYYHYSTKSYNVDDIANAYKIIWGESPEQKDYPDMGGCPIFVYVESIKKYVGLGGYHCGCGATPDFTVRSIYNYEEDNNNVYVYLRFGHIEYNEGVVYTDYANNITVPMSKLENPKNGRVTINEDNYNLFAKYKLTFEKVDKYYKFISAEHM